MQQSPLQRNAQSWLILGASLAIILTLMLLSLGACAAGKSGPTPTPTKTQIPTFTPAPPTATATVVPPTATATPLPSPTPAPTATPAPPTATPTVVPLPPTKAPPPTAAPIARPAPTTAPPTAVPVADPCANIGGDGCKWKVTGGPRTGANGGLELKLQFIFIHSGVEGGQPQGSYFVVLEKDGVRLPISDKVRSVPLASSQGSLGKYNYEYTLGVDKLPGNTVAGNYTLWVLDGNGDRDSRNVTFSVPANQGLLWIQFDQA